MRVEVVEVRDGSEYFWDVEIRMSDGTTSYRCKSKRNHPDQLSAYMAVTREIQEEQTNGNNC